MMTAVQEDSDQLACNLTNLLAPDECYPIRHAIAKGIYSNLLKDNLKELLYFWRPSDVQYDLRKHPKGVIYSRLQSISLFIT